MVATEDAAGGGVLRADDTPAEKAMRTLLDYLVDPLLPASALYGKEPSAEKKAALGKQMHSVVVLYNYYHRKYFPQLEFLDPETFCIVAVTVKPSLSKFIGPADIAQQVSLKKVIMNACDISSTLYASKEFLEMEGWPISSIAIFLVDSKEENCFLEFGSITLGVWSLIELELDKPFHAPVEHTCMKKLAVGSKRSCGCSYAPLRDEGEFDQRALSMLEDKTGINKSDFHILECHLTYSLSQEKTTTRFYIVKCMKPMYEEVEGISMITLADLRDIFASLRGYPLGYSLTYGATSLVEYYHLLPYLNILSNRFSRQTTLDASFPSEMNPIDVHEKDSPRLDKAHLDKNCGLDNLSDKKNQSMSMSSRNATLIAAEVASKQKYTSSAKDSAIATCRPDANNVGSSLEINEFPVIKDPSVSCKFGTTLNKSKTYPEIKRDGSCEIELPLAVSEPSTVDRISSLSQLQKMSPGNESIIDGKGLNTCSIKHGDNNSHFCSNGANDGFADKAYMVGLDLSKNYMVGLAKKPRITENKDAESFSRKEASQTVQDAAGLSVSDRPLLPFHSYPDSYEFHLLMASKKDELQEASLRVLLKKRDDLSRQVRHLQDEIAQCEMNIEAVSRDREGSLKLELESIIEACNAFCSSPMQVVTSTARNQSEEIKGKGLSEAFFTSRSSCQELDDICRQNSWMIPKYTLLPLLTNGNFQSTVTVKGLDFESTVHSNFMSSPCEARCSAASAMLRKVYSMTSNAQQSRS